MPAEHTATFQLDTATTYEAMTVGGRKLVSGWRWLPLIVQTVALVLLAPFGIIAIGFLFATEPTRATLVFYLPLAFFVLGASFLWLHNKNYRTLAEISAKARFNRISTVELTPLTMALITPHSRWVTGWQDVEHVVKAKRSIIIVVAGIVLPVPNAALTDPDAVYADVQRWFDASR